MHIDITFEPNFMQFSGTHLRNHFAYSRPWSPFSPLPWASSNMLEDLLAPASVAGDGRPDAVPKNVTSVVGNVLDEVCYCN